MLVFFLFLLVGADVKGKAQQPKKGKAAYSVPIPAGTGNGSASQYGGGFQLSPRWFIQGKQLLPFEGCGTSEIDF